MAEDDVELGHVVDLTLGEPSGTELVADAAIGATTLTVDYAGDFEDVGEVVLNGTTLAYTSIAYGAAETDPDVITLAVPLAAAAVTDDKVGRVSGGEPLSDWLLHVSLGDGHPVDIPIPFEQRGMWSGVDTSTPVPVLVSADLERLVEVPGRPPALDQAVIDTPFIDLYRTSDTTWPDDPGPGTTFTGFTGWTIETRASMSIASGIVTPDQAGLYLLVLTVQWAGNSSGRRVIRLSSSTAGDLKTISANPPDASAFTQQAIVIHRAVVDETFQVLARQTSGAGLDVIGARTTWQIVRLEA